MAMVYPFKKYNYTVTINGKVVVGFSEVCAPDVSSDPIEYREGNFAVNTVGKQPGLNTSAHIFPKYCSGEHVLRLEKGIYSGEIPDR